MTNLPPDFQATLDEFNKAAAEVAEMNRIHTCKCTHLEVVHYIMGCRMCKCPIYRHNGAK